MKTTRLAKATTPARRTDNASIVAILTERFSTPTEAGVTPKPAQVAIRTKLRRKIASVEAAARADPKRFGSLWEEMRKADNRTEVNRLYREYRRLSEPSAVPADAVFLDPDQAANLMGGDINGEQVRELARRGVLPGFKLPGVNPHRPGRLWRFRREDVIALVERGKVESNAHVA